MPYGIMSEFDAPVIEKMYMERFAEGATSEQVIEFIDHIEKKFGWSAVEWDQGRQVVGYLVIREGHEMNSELHQLVRRAIGEEVKEIDGKKPSLSTHMSPEMRRMRLCEFANQVCEYYGKQKTR